MSGSNEEFDFTTKAPQQIKSGTIFGKSKTAAVSPQNPQVRYIATRGAGGGRTVGFFELNDGVNPPQRITDEAARGFIQTRKLGSINTNTNVLPILPPNQEVNKSPAGTAGAGATTGAQGAAAPLPKAVIEERLRGEGVNENTKQEFVTSNQAFSNNRRQGQSFNIGRFRAEVSGADSVLPTHSFLVVFSPMPWAIQKFPASAGNLDSILTMRCDNVVLPSINLLQEQNIRRYGFGPVENVAYGVNVGDFTLQFIVDKNAFVVQFFEEWLNKIVNRDSFGGANMNNVLAGGRRPYEIAYKDTYACSSINVFVYDRSQNNVMEYNIYDAFPTGIQSMNMSWSEENTLMKLNITFSFTDLRIKQSPAKNKQEGAFGSSVDFQNALVNGPKMTDAELKSFLSSNPLVYSGSLTDLTKETITIGDGARTRGSPPTLPPATFQKAIVTDVGIPTSRDIFGQPLTYT